MSEAEPRLHAATLDGPNCVTVRFNRRVAVQDWPKERFRLKIMDGPEIAIAAVNAVGGRHEQTTVFHVETAEPLDFVNHLYEAWVDGAGSRLVSVRDVLLDRERHYDADVPLGAIWSADATVFRVFAPTAQGAEVVVADELTGEVGLNVHPMQPRGKGIWEATVAGNLEGKFYAYRLRGIGFNPQMEITDIYAVCTQGRAARSLIVDMSKLDPPGFREQAWRGPASPVDAIVCEAHVRDLTIAPDSGVQHKGKFLGLTESGTRLPDDPSVCTALDHLVEMGVTHVQLMPVQDFDNDETRDDQYEWGYMPVHFNSPDGWYATSVTGPARIGELKQLIHALHARGIGIIMDVVYNHTAKAATFERLVPSYYYRKTPADRFCNGSGCGNEFMSESPMARRFILDSLKMWLREYQVDGFRFDLLGLIDIETVKQIQAELRAIRPDLILTGEPWTGGPTPLKPISDKMQVRGTGVASFHDGFRDAIKGDRDGGPPGYIQAGDRAEWVRKGLEGAVHDWALDPVDVVNYFECHDNLTTWDKLAQTRPESPEADLDRMARFAAVILLTAQGMPFFQAGQEFGRSKRGHHNSYNLPDVINRITWSQKKQRAGLCAYYRGLIALRKAHPAFRLRTRAEVEHRVWFGDTPNERCLAYIIHSDGVPDEPCKAIVVLLNGHHEPVEFQVGEGLWAVYADADATGAEPLRQIEHRLTLPAHSGAVLGRRE